jgi:hypothetical protein
MSKTLKKSRNDWFDEDYGYEYEDIRSSKERKRMERKNRKKRDFEVLEQEFVADVNERRYGR